MKLRKLEVSNLLSFNEFEIEFQDDLNIIVGPNGSGKSNIIRVLSFISLILRRIDEDYGNELPPYPLTANKQLLNSVEGASFKGTKSNQSISIKLEFKLTTSDEKAVMITFIRVVLATSLFSSFQGKESALIRRVITWIKDSVTEKNFEALFYGTLVATYPGNGHGGWEVFYLFNYDGKRYKWIVTDTAVSGSITEVDSGDDSRDLPASISETLLGIPIPVPAVFPAELKKFTLADILPPASGKLEQLRILANKQFWSEPDPRSEFVREAKEHLKIDLLSRTYQTSRLARVFLTIFDNNLSFVGEGYRGLGLGGSPPNNIGLPQENILELPIPKNNPGYLPLLLFKLKNSGSPEQRDIFSEIQKTFESLADKSFDVSISPDFSWSVLPVCKTPKQSDSVNTPCLFHHLIAQACR